MMTFRVDDDVDVNNVSLAVADDDGDEVVGWSSSEGRVRSGATTVVVVEGLADVAPDEVRSAYDDDMSTDENIESISSAVRKNLPETMEVVSTYSCRWADEMKVVMKDLLPYTASIRISGKGGNLYSLAFSIVSFHDWDAYDAETSVDLPTSMIVDHAGAILNAMSAWAHYTITENHFAPVDDVAVLNRLREDGDIGDDIVTDVVEKFGQWMK